jgi:hypothetical protein
MSKGKGKQIEIESESDSTFESNSDSSFSSQDEDLDIINELEGLADEANDHPELDYIIGLRSGNQLKHKKYDASDTSNFGQCSSSGVTSDYLDNDKNNTNSTSNHIKSTLPHPESPVKNKQHSKSESPEIQSPIKPVSPSKNNQSASKTDSPIKSKSTCSSPIKSKSNTTNSVKKGSPIKSSNKTSIVKNCIDGVHVEDPSYKKQKIKK